MRNFNNMNSSVAYIYGFLPTDFGRVSDAMMESATDNSVYTWENNSIYYITVSYTHLRAHET